MTRWMICKPGASSCGWDAHSTRNGIGNEITHWRTGTESVYLNALKRRGSPLLQYIATANL